MCIRDSSTTGPGAACFQVTALTVERDGARRVVATTPAYGDTMTADARSLPNLDERGRRPETARVDLTAGWSSTCLLYTSRCV